MVLGKCVIISLVIVFTIQFISVQIFPFMILIISIHILIMIVIWIWFIIVFFFISSFKIIIGFWLPAFLCIIFIFWNSIFLFIIFIVSIVTLANFIIFLKLPFYIRIFHKILNLFLIITIIETLWLIKLTIDTKRILLRVTIVLTILSNLVWVSISVVWAMLLIILRTLL